MKVLKAGSSAFGAFRESSVVIFEAAAAAHVKQWRAASASTLADYQARAARAGGLGLGKENGFRELVSKV